MADEGRRWEDSPVVKQVKLWLWPGALFLCAWFVKDSYAALRERVASAEAKALEVSRSSDRMGVQVEGLAVSQRVLTDRVDAGFRRMEERLDKVIEGNPRRIP